MSDTNKGFKIPNIQLEQPLEKLVINCNLVIIIYFPFQYLLVLGFTLKKSIMKTTD